MNPPPISMSEDCLYLNIYTPAHAHEGSNMPVSHQVTVTLGRGHVFQDDEKGQKQHELYCSVDSIEKPCPIWVEKGLLSHAT